MMLRRPSRPFSQWLRFKKQYKLNKFGHIQHKFDFHKDELDMNFEDPEKDPIRMVKEIESSGTFEVSPPSVARTLYNMGKAGISSELIFRSIENDIEGWKSYFDRRLAFGFLYGALKLNMNKNLILFARNEFDMNFVNIKANDKDNFSNLLYEGMYGVLLEDICEGPRG